MLKHNFGLISAILNIVAIVPYIYAIVKGKARPNRVTWTIWTFLSLLILLASVASGAHTTLLWLASAVFNSSVIMVLSFWRGTWQKSSLEFVCLILGLIGAIIWYITHRSDYSVYISSVVDLLAIAPTVRKVWLNPDSEPVMAWSIGIVAALLNVAAIDQLRAVIIVPPLVVVFWHTLVLSPIYLAGFKTKLQQP